MALKLKHRRARGQKTDFRARLALLRSGKPRLVVRKSLNYITGQIISYDRSGDKIIASASSKELKRLGWTKHCGNATAAYLTGMILGKKAGVKEAILDVGLQSVTKGNTIYAFAKGVADAGVNVPIGAEVLPPEDRMTGKHINAHEEFTKVKAKL